MKISEAFDNYMTYYMEMRGRASSTMCHYEYIKKSIATFTSDVDVERLSLNDIIRWKRHLAGSRRANTVRNYISALRQVLGWLERHGSIALSKDSVPAMEREEVTVSFVTPEEVRQIIDASDLIRTKFIVAFLYASGLRISEFLSLNVDSIQDKKFTVIGKGGKERLGFIDERADYYMKAYLRTRNDRERALVVSTRHKKRLSASTVQLIVRNAVDKAGLDKKITPHTFRHGCATNLLSNGVDIRYIAEILGHVSLNNTKIYTHITNPDLELQYRRGHSI